MTKAMQTELKHNITEDNEVKGALVSINNESYYKIANVDKMRPFFMSIVSDSNHWLFISSNGGLTAGRRNAEFALFPYYTDDKITESADITGSKTIFQIHKDTGTLIWEPFSERQMGQYDIHRNLYKNSYGNKVIFEEINTDLDLAFRYEWNSSDEFGFIKTSTLRNTGDKSIKITVLDGLQNIVPANVNSELQATRSNLVDAYKKSELYPDVGLGTYALSAVIVDKAEPSEALKANTVWSLGIEDPTYLISSLQLNDFRKGYSVTQEIDMKAEKGAYFVVSDIEIDTNTEKSWMFIADVSKSITQVVALSEKIKQNDITEIIKKDVEAGTENLIKFVGAADGLQLTADPLTNTRHFANTMFNIMRGGIFDDDYNIEKADFLLYLSKANKAVYDAHKNDLEALPEVFSTDTIKSFSNKSDNPHLKRLCLEYLPLKFSRRHGDPSRPWNRFSINTKNEIDGSKILDYEGNWRDIFQNWEALAHAYPEFIESMIHKFLNASTFEGYNPYRVTKDGFDWEVIEEHDPWSYIGYWGDHQIIYLLKFLEFINDYYPSRLESLFHDNVFVYANVPYKIKSYQDTLNNPKDTIDFDYKLNEEIQNKKAVLGADAALITDQNNQIYNVNLVEKLLATVLAKVSNFIPEGGIWLNTQRPEWNDANNALVGNGVSMVTLYYLRRFLNFFNTILEQAPDKDIVLSEAFADFFAAIHTGLREHESILEGPVSNKDRKTVLDALGTAGSNYRLNIYEKGFNGKKKSISKTDLLDFITITQNYLEHSIRANKRSDEMYHAYNLMTLENSEEISISYLPEMLEGQVAVLSSGYLSPNEALSLLNGLKSSALFREDQYSYILYPNKDLPRFDKKNNIPASKVEGSKLLQQLVRDGNIAIIEKDILGDYHFNANFNNAKSLKQALNQVSGDYPELVAQEASKVLAIFEEVFNHKAFTGRSGTFFGYEGLGSIYWHMVSKLLLAVQENCLGAVRSGESEKIIGGLLDHYYEINAGIGVHKSPDLYGAFPTDPYSHTPATKGAQQPGMTGQVKEDILSRFGELGVFVTEGQLYFNPRLLQSKEFLNTENTFHYTALNDEEKSIHLNPGELCFTCCQVPVIYKKADKNALEVVFTDGKTKPIEALKLDKELSKNLFERTGAIERINVSITI
ncbi:hypothetical protein [Gaetbulibacter aestuarii]|uniref:Cellobiose phosphorylase n=1 Tax=Gaetbulibacter aestuarii TaxID=1502358 RepID=A0ABW7MWM6_9FLAO